MGKHTPGPWEALGKTIWQTARECQTTQFIADVGSHGDYVRSAQTLLANARLIAAAPALLETLTMLYDGCCEERGFAQSTTAIQVRAAIADATEGGDDAK